MLHILSFRVRILPKISGGQQGPHFKINNGIRFPWPSQQVWSPHNLLALNFNPDKATNCAQQRHTDNVNNYIFFTVPSGTRSCQAII